MYACVLKMNFKTMFRQNTFYCICPLHNDNILWMFGPFFPPEHIHIFCMMQAICVNMIKGSVIPPLSHCIRFCQNKRGALYVSRNTRPPCKTFHKCSFSASQIAHKPNNQSFLGCHTQKRSGKNNAELSCFFFVF